ncbi:hypothetical protein MPNT_160022 [Candidatus Methylacidithermus pantelleriae]|uniref:Uncharacterized protein n=1 Tax=Candidatus Methylacidithermus pantelleriae TaxID=2744239 RepID=A0A8J2BIL3_9BACT|nr:hypothetical protein MPNT_160022 [Candidatus Methylacidithermus pantelleriae]
MVQRFSQVVGRWGGALSFWGVLSKGYLEDEPGALGVYQTANKLNEMARGTQLKAKGGEPASDLECQNRAICAQ